MTVDITNRAPRIVLQRTQASGHTWISLAVTWFARRSRSRALSGSFSFLWRFLSFLCFLDFFLSFLSFLSFFLEESESLSLPLLLSDTSPFDFLDDLLLSFSLSRSFSRSLSLCFLDFFFDFLWLDLSESDESARPRHPLIERHQRARVGPRSHNRHAICTAHVAHLNRSSQQKSQKGRIAMPVSKKRAPFHLLMTGSKTAMRRGKHSTIGAP